MSRHRVVVSRAENQEHPSTWKDFQHVMLFLLDANAQHLTSDSKSALTVAAGLAMSSGKLTVVFLDDSAAGERNEAERGEMKSALEALGLSEVSILEERIEGKGKGSVEFWVCRVKPGRIMFEIGGVPQDLARRAMELASAKLALETRFVTRIGGED